MVNVEKPDGTGRMWLSVVLASGAALTSEVTARIAALLRRQASPRHVPDEVVAVPATPVHIAGKKPEVPVKRLLTGAAGSTVVNRAIMRDPAAIDAFVALAVSLHDRA